MARNTQTPIQLNQCAQAYAQDSRSNPNFQYDSSKDQEIPTRLKRRRVGCADTSGHMTESPKESGRGAQEPNRPSQAPAHPGQDSNLYKNEPAIAVPAN